ncbi:MAG: ABC transporter ATP-binding protein [Dehalococcoidales bacterium]|nr:ABC transporter ATP-binding protein [Dehalococcoidales bacterium]
MIGTTVTKIQTEIGSGRDIVLRANGLFKRFGTLEAVKGVSFELHRGEVFGFLGPNGAGKSTTVGMILGLIAPTAGSVEIFGVKQDGNRWNELRRVGAIIEEPAFYPYLSGWDNLEVLAISIGDIPRSKITEVLERVNLLDRAKDQYGHYSMGMKQRLGIASTLLRSPELIILDEPTNGLDPAGTKEIRDLIPQLALENRAVLLCSHLLHEVEMVCSRVAIIKQGVIIANAPIKELLSRGNQLQIKVDKMEEAKAILGNLPWIKSVTREDDHLVIDVPQDRSADVNLALTEKGIRVSELFNRSTSLESVFLQLTGGAAGD